MHPHCPDDWQPCIRLWQGHVAEPATLSSTFILQGLDIAILATGARAVTSDNNRASMVRCKAIGPDQVSSS